MAYKLIVTQMADSDLDDALGYISKQLSNPTAAARLFEKVEACYAQLKEFPFLYEVCHDIRLKSLGYRKVPIGNYVLIFHPVESEETVYVLRFLYGRRNYEEMI